MQPKVSIVIPVYNGADYLKEAIDSALEQTYKNIEIIVVNDGSNDNGKTKEIAESYGNKINYYEKENGGVSTALNLALEKMTGDYFSWLSHDDKYYPNKVEKNIEEILKHDNNTIIYSNFDLIDENGIKYSTVKYDHKMLTDKPDYALLRGCIGGITLLIPKKAFDKYGKFDEELKCTQDYEMWFRMLESYKFVHMEDVLTMTRIHRNQTTNTSPRVIKEGNWLWSHITENYPTERKIEYEGSEYLFNLEMANYIKSSNMYKEAEHKALSFAEKALEKSKKASKEKSVTIVIIDNGNEEDIEKTMNSIQEQLHKNYEIVIEGERTYKKYQNFKDRKEAIKKIKTDYYTFINAGVTARRNWLSDEILIACATKKGIVIPNYINPNSTTLANNINTLLSPIDGILFDANYSETYDDLYSYLTKITKKAGSIAVEDNYIDNSKADYTMSDIKTLLNEAINNEESSDYQLAALCYDISVMYNSHIQTGQKIKMYEKCDELKEMMFSRSFRILKKYIDKKKEKKHQKEMREKVNK